MISENKLDFWVKHCKNVLFVGKHGIGKTAIIKAAFERAKLNWLYFSASTLDPWVDFVGVPREMTDENGIVYLDLVRPRAFAYDTVEALFFDEFNRSPKKVRNAVMELLQFKSINGKKFNNLKMIWAAINPENDEENKYDVEPLDPAQKDRFHIVVDIPYKPHAPWFNKEFGIETSKSAIEWWESLPDEVKNEVTPRRLEYALRINAEGGDIRDVLPKSANCSKLSSLLRSGPIRDKLRELFIKKDIVASKEFFEEENNFQNSLPYLIKDKDYMSLFSPLLSKERISVLVSKNTDICDFICEHSSSVPIFKEVLDNICQANQNKKLVKKISVARTKSPVTVEKGDIKFHFNKAQYLPGEWATKVRKFQSCSLNTTSRRLNAYNEIYNDLPETITAQEAITILEILNRIFRSSNPSSFQSGKYRNAIPLVNQCILNINVETGMDWGSICTKYYDKTKWIVKKLDNSKLFKPDKVVVFGNTTVSQTPIPVSIPSNRVVVNPNLSPSQDTVEQKSLMHKLKDMIFSP